MKKGLSFREKIDRYFLTLEERGKLDPIFFLFIMYLLSKVVLLVGIVYFIYKVAKILISWI